VDTVSCVCQAVPTITRLKKPGESAVNLVLLPTPDYLSGPKHRVCAHDIKRGPITVSGVPDYNEAHQAGAHRPDGHLVLTWAISGGLSTPRVQVMAAPDETAKVHLHHSSKGDLMVQVIRAQLLEPAQDRDPRALECLGVHHFQRLTGPEMEPALTEAFSVLDVRRIDLTQEQGRMRAYGTGYKLHGAHLSSRLMIFFQPR
jgi:hypothetical protein